MQDSTQKKFYIIMGRSGAGKGTQAQHIGFVLARVTLIGAIFLGVVAVLPVIIQGITGFTALAVGGTSLLIAVSVVLDLIKKVDAQLSMKEY